MSVRAAVLILEHQNPHRLAELARSLRHPDIDLYLHIDARVAIKPFVARLRPDEQTAYVLRRVPVRWGSVTQVEAGLAALRQAMNSGRDYGRYALLSGADLRVAPLERILADWSTPTEFVRVEHRLVPGGPGPTWRVARRHYPGAAGNVRKSLSGRIPRSVDPTIALHHGSAWWALTAGAAAHVRNFVDEHPSWMRFHRHTFGSDEIIVPSIIANSPYAPQVVQDYSRRSAGDDHIADVLHGMHYIDWSDVTAAHPRILGLADLEAIRASSALFARKIDATSAELVAALRTDAHADGR